MARCPLPEATSASAMACPTPASPSATVPPPPCACPCSRLCCRLFSSPRSHNPFPLDKFIILPDQPLVDSSFFPFRTTLPYSLQHLCRFVSQLRGRI